MPTVTAVRRATPLSTSGKPMFRVGMARHHLPWSVGHRCRYYDRRRRRRRRRCCCRRRRRRRVCLQGERHRLDAVRPAPSGRAGKDGCEESFASAARIIAAAVFVVVVAAPGAHEKPFDASTPRRVSSHREVEDPAQISSAPLGISSATTRLDWVCVLRGGSPSSKYFCVPGYACVWTPTLLLYPTRKYLSSPCGLGQFSNL